MKLVSIDQMVALEKDAVAAGLTYESMMNHAGHGVAKLVRGMEENLPALSVIGLAGPGNNGGDTLIALAELAAAGWRATAYTVRREPDALLDRLRKGGGVTQESSQDPDRSLLIQGIRSAAVLLDGLLGTGSKPPLRGDVSEVLAAAKMTLAEADHPPYVVAVDCPSGIDCDTGEVAEQSIAADLTITMAAVKQGLLKLPAFDYVGDLQVVDIGLPTDLPGLVAPGVEVADQDMVAGFLPRRPADAHKGTFGTAVVVAGSVNYTGAAALAGAAAYRAGAGLVTLAVPSLLHTVLAGHIPEATWLLLPHEIGVISRDAASVLVDGIRSGCTALLVGPGMGLENTTADFVARLLQVGGGPSGGPATMGFLGASGAGSATEERHLPALVVDADGLKLISRLPRWPTALPPLSVLTPHPGEMAILTGLTKEEVQRNRTNVARMYAREWGHVVVLKGAFTVVAAPSGRLTIIPVATAALARAGTGDVLAGIIVGLRAQGVDAYEAAVAAAWIHGQAGMLAAARLGSEAAVLAGDVLSCIADVLAAIANS